MTANELRHTQHPFLKDLSDEDIGVLAAFAMPVRFSPGQRIFEQGGMADRFYLIHDGRVSLHAVEAGGQWTEIQQLLSGDVLGWSWLFEPYEWQYEAVAVEETTATFFYGTWLREKCEQDAALGLKVMKRIAGLVIARLQATRERIRILSSKSSS
jgi:CRP/FNR family cyclic AMP-dependent transcriptional regulator